MQKINNGSSVCWVLGWEREGCLFNRTKDWRPAGSRAVTEPPTACIGHEDLFFKLNSIRGVCFCRTEDCRPVEDRGGEEEKTK